MQRHDWQLAHRMPLPGCKQWNNEKDRHEKAAILTKPLYFHNGLVPARWEVPRGLAIHVLAIVLVRANLTQLKSLYQILSVYGRGIDERAPP